MQEMSPELLLVIKKFLKYSFEDINFKYGDLTPTEKQLCSPDEFNQLVTWLRNS